MANAIEYALMAGRSYQTTRGKINWLPDLPIRMAGANFGIATGFGSKSPLPSGNNATLSNDGVIHKFNGSPHAANRISNQR